MTTMTMTRTSHQNVTERVRTMVMSLALAATVAVTMAMTASAMYQNRTNATPAGIAAASVQPVPERAPAPSAAPHIVSERYDVV